MRTAESRRRGLRYVVATTLVAAVAVAVGLPAHAAEADDEARSFAGCPLLLEGDEGPCVERLQRDLNLVESDHDLPVTGFFGERTRIAVLDFQGRNGLDADGNVGAETADALQDQLSEPSPRPPEDRPVEPGPAGCDEGSRSQAADIARDGGAVTVAESEGNGVQVALRYSPDTGCAWALGSAQGIVRQVGVQLQRSTDGGATWTRTQHAVAGPGERRPVTHSGLYQATAPYHVRACAWEMTFEFDIDRSSRRVDTELDLAETQCTAPYQGAVG